MTIDTYLGHTVRPTTNCHRRGSQVAAQRGPARALQLGTY